MHKPTRASSSRVDSVWSALGAPTPFDPHAAFVTSPVFSPATLAVLRLTLALYALATLCVVLGFDVNVYHDGNSFLSYFTELSYIGLCSYFFASGVQTAVYAASHGQSYPLERWPRCLQLLHSLLYSTITTFPFIVTIVFWSLLADGAFDSTFSTWSNISIHAMNCLFALFELIFTHGGPQPWAHIPLLIVLLALCLAVAYITHATQGFYTYSFLDPQKEGSLLAAYIVGIAVGCAVVFSVAKGVQLLRCLVVRRYGRRRARFGADAQGSRSAEALDEWEEVELDADRPTRRIVLKTSREADLNEAREKEGEADLSMETSTSDGEREKKRSPVSGRSAV